MHYLECKKENISINGRNYSFQLIPALKAAKIGAKLARKVIASLSSVGLAYSANNFDSMFNSVESVLSDESIDELYQLIFSEQAQLHCDGKFVQDPDIFFQGKPAEMFQIIGYALRCNCEDFFTTIGGWLKQNIPYSEILKTMSEKGIEIPSEILNLLQISVPPSESK